MKISLFLLFFLAIQFLAQGQNAVRTESLISQDDLLFLKTMTRDVLEKAKVRPGQSAGEGNKNNTGGTVVTPGGNYPAFWIRDYAMSLETGFVSSQDQLHMLKLTAETQCDQTWITKKGGMVPFGSIADHVRLSDSLPVYFPGTYSFEDQGDGSFGMLPPICDQFFFIQMAWYYVRTTGDVKILSKVINGKKLIDRLEIAFAAPASRLDNGLVYTVDAYRAVDFGFRDAVTITGDLCFASLLKLRSARQMAWLFSKVANHNRAGHYKTVADGLKAAIPKIFMDNRGMLLASSGKSKQADVWATVLAVSLGVLQGDDLKKTSNFLADAYNKGILAYKGNVRHILDGDDFNDKTAWEVSMARKNEYQNGAYWGTPTGWVAAAIAKTNVPAAQRLVKEYIADLRENDFRKGKGFGAPFECFHPPGHKQNPVYLTTVASPYIVFTNP